jgi:hypothetical protein
MTTMSVDALKNNLTNPARVYLWEVLFPNPVAGDPETLLLRCQTTSMPGRSFGRIHIPFKQSGGIEFPGKLTYSHNWELTFQEGADREIFDAFYGWCQAVIHDKYNTGDLIIKRNILLHLIETDGSVSKKIRLIGCFPSEMRDVALDQNSEDAMKFTVVFGYDRWEEAA